MHESKASAASQKVCDIEKESFKFAAGMPVLAYWKDSAYDGWFPAQIASKNNDGTWMVTYTQWPQWGQCKTVESNLQYAPGTQAKGYWKDSVYCGWFPVQIQSRNGDGSYQVSWPEWPTWGTTTQKAMDIKA